MHCASCVRKLEESVSKLVGIKNVNVNLLANSMSLNYDKKVLNIKTIEATVKKCGFTANLKSKKNENTNDESKILFIRFISSAVFLLPLLYISMGHMIALPLPRFFNPHINPLNFCIWQLVLCIPIIVINFRFFTNGFKTLFQFAPNMNSLIAIASSAALIYGCYNIYRIANISSLKIAENYAMNIYFESAAMILTLVTLGKYLESLAKKRTGSAINGLLKLKPDEALIEVDSQQIVISTDRIQKGDIVIIRPGDSIPVDGVVVSGTSFVDESAITGESIAKRKTIGDKVISACVNTTGSFKMKALSVGNDTTLARIIALVERASSSKAPIAKLADKVSSVFVPVVILIAVVCFFVWCFLGYELEFSLSLSISVLVISCPCALGLATPTAIMVAMGKGAENSILIKDAQALQNLSSINCVLFDKTGTLTKGRPEINKIKCSSDKEKFLSLAASIESLSEHPLAKKITSFAKDNKIKLMDVDDFNSIPGKGISCVINNKPYFAGNIKFFEEHNKTKAQVAKNYSVNHVKADETVIYFFDNIKFFGMITLVDKIKEGSKDSIQKLKDLKIKTVMLSGDRKSTAQEVANSLGIDEVYFELMPEDKEIIVQRMKKFGFKVAMLGDGINDAPALALSDVGISLSSATDIAISSADVILANNKLSSLNDAMHLSNTTMKNIKQNLFWSLIYNSLGIPLAAGVFYSSLGLTLNPMFAAMAMSLSSICVVLNALRLKNIKFRRDN